MVTHEHPSEHEDCRTEQEKWFFLLYIEALLTFRVQRLEATVLCAATQNHVQFLYIQYIHWHSLFYC